MGLSHVEFHAGHPERARMALLRAVHADPEEPETWVRAAEVWQALGDAMTARAALERALALDPVRQDARERLDRPTPPSTPRAPTRG